MIKVGAWSILSAIFIPLIGFAGLTLMSQGERISKLETAEQYKVRMMEEIHKDVREIRQRLD